VKARSAAEAAQAKERATLAAPRTPSADFVGELQRAQERADADHPRDALGHRRDGERGEG
jgi:hypothetical protein